ncbi:MAG TPA: hypothetical protein VND95_13810 [Stellaceae bacterium]|nr:hypothetical protein [Stellaceae bacterium]
MPDDGGHDDAQILHSAYAERVREIFKVFADNLSVGENEALCRERFVRGLQFARRARDLALRAAEGEVFADPLAELASKRDEPAAGEEIAAGALSPEHQAMVDKALAGTRGTSSPYPRR